MNALFQVVNNTIQQSATKSYCWLQQQRHMSKYLSKAAKKRLVLTTKRAHKGFYKGNGATKEGRLTSKGKFIANPLRRLELVIPDLTGFKVRLKKGEMTWNDSICELMSVYAHIGFYILSAQAIYCPKRPEGASRAATKSHQPLVLFSAARDEWSAYLTNIFSMPLYFGSRTK